MSDDSNVNLNTIDIEKLRKEAEQLTCKCRRQSYIQIMRPGNTCEEYNECIDCGRKLMPDISMAERIQQL